MANSIGQAAVGVANAINNPATQQSYNAASTQPNSNPATNANANTPPPGWKGYNGISYGDSNWYNAYSQAIANGQNNSYQLGKYQQLAKQYGLKDYSQNISQDALRQRSMKALEGDQDSITYLKNMGYTPMSGDALWKGYNQDQIANMDAAQRWQYMRDNPDAPYTEKYQTGFYNQWNNDIMNNKPMSAQDMQYYKDWASKWNLTDNTDPYNKQLTQNNLDKQNAMNAQDTALNQTMAGLDANSFNALQKTQQDMATKGLTGSGIAQDAYLRAQMANNQTYQKAFADAATQKASLADQYDKQAANITDAQQKMAETVAQNKAQNQIDLQKLQTTQDQFLTQQSGYIFINGKPLTDPNTGKPYTTLDWQKMTETQRHDMATEANTYNIAAMNNDTNRAKIASDAAIADAKLQYDYKNLDFNKEKWAQDVQDTITKLNIAQQNANTASDKNTLSALQTEVTNARDAVTAAQKAKDTAGAAKAEARLEKALGNVDSFISGKQ